MAQSFRSDSASPFRPASARLLRLLLLAACALPLLPQIALAAPPAAGTASGWSTVTTGQSFFQIAVQGDDPNAAAGFSAKYGAGLETAITELDLVFRLDPPAQPIPIYVYTDQTAYAAVTAAPPRPEIDGVTVLADTTARDITLFGPSFEQLSDKESENELRHAVSHVLTAVAANGRMPWGFDEGIAQYVERPVNEQLARIAGIVQTASQRGQIDSWADINSGNAGIDRTVAAAEAYSIIAFLIENKGLGQFADFLKAMQTADNWRTGLRTAFGSLPDDLESRWKAELPKWVAGGWRTNLIGGFDLEPARALLQQANYAAAQAALAESLALNQQLGHPPLLADVDTMEHQCEVGVQAETLMDQTQQALAAHEYDRAANLLAQAKELFGQLPAEQQPAEFIATYEDLANQGLEAAAQLDRANQLRHSWRDYPAARSAAKHAGAIYATLGDTEGASQAQSVLDDLDTRQRRIVLLLGALGVLSVAWLALWLWARGPSQLVWR